MIKQRLNSFAVQDLKLNSFAIQDLKLNSFKLPKKWLKKPVRAGAYQTWLVDDGSLTARLKSKYIDFAVKPILLKNTKSLYDEAALLGLKNQQHALIREVLLIGNHQPVVFAHSVLPQKSLRSQWNSLGKLGSKPLGAALFSNPKVRRTPLAYQKLSPKHALYQHASQYLAQKPAFLWARRSIFSLDCANIMVTEVFLPALLNT